MMRVSAAMITSWSIVHDAQKSRDGHYDVNYAKEQCRDADLLQDGQMGEEPVGNF